MSRILKVKYSQMGTAKSAHKFKCTVDDVTVTFVQSSHSITDKLNQHYINVKGNVQHVPDLSEYTEEELFQLSVVSNIQMDLELLQKIQKHLVYCYDHRIFRRTEIVLK